jgi:hypothetical protein
MSSHIIIYYILNDLYVDYAPYSNTRTVGPLKIYHLSFHKSIVEPSGDEDVIIIITVDRIEFIALHHYNTCAQMLYAYRYNKNKKTL